MAKRQRLRAAEVGGEQPARKGPTRNVQSIEFKPDQWEAIVKAALVEGHPPGAWVRAAALDKARRMGLWDPLSKPGPLPAPAPEESPGDD